MKSVNCDCCGLPMHLVKQGKTKRRNRIRRFNCNICNISTTIYADGMRDLYIEPIRAIKEAGNINSKEEEYQIREKLLKNINR